MKINLLAIKGKLVQKGKTPAIFNAGFDGANKTFSNHQNHLAISPECFKNGLFHHRIEHFEENESYEESIRKFEYNWTKYRGGIVTFKKESLSMAASLTVDRLKSIKPIQELDSNDEATLGIQMEKKGKNEEESEARVKSKNYPGEKTGYLGVEFYVRLYLDFNKFTEKNEIVEHFLRVKAKKENKEAEFNEWLNKNYFIENGVVNEEKVRNEIEELLNNYQHPVHNRYNPALFMEDMKFSNLQSMKDYSSYLERLEEIE